MASEKRIDPDDGAAYTYEELTAYYRGTFKKKAIDEYWENACTVVKGRRGRKGKRDNAEPEPKAKAKAKAKRRARAKAEPKVEPPLEAPDFDESKNRQLQVKSLFDKKRQSLVTNKQLEVVVQDRPTPGDGEALVRNVYVSIDPTHRLWLTEKPQYMPPAEAGAPMRAATLGKVEVSKDPKLPEGSWVTGFGGIQDYYVTSSAAWGATVVEEVVGKPITAHLSVLSLIIGLTAWIGTNEICKPGEGEVFCVSAGAGAVGSLAGQLAKIAGAKVCGFVGSDDKAKWLKEECKFDCAINYKTEEVLDRLKEFAPDGVDCYFENTGGQVTEAVFSHLRNNARVALCGVISSYSAGRLAGLRSYENILHRRATVQGFICSDHTAKMPSVVQQLTQYLAEGKIAYKEDIQEGIAKYASIVNMLFSGANSGKLIMKI